MENEERNDKKICTLIQFQEFESLSNNVLSSFQEDKTFVDSV